MLKIYGLLGFPIQNSLSPLIHNFFFRVFYIKSKYILIERSKFSIEDLIDLKKIPVYGISITMPYKNLIYSFFENRYPKSNFLQLFNTLKLESGEYVPYNTDIYGAKKVLSDIENLSSKKIIIFGAGSLARVYLFVLISFHFDINNIILLARNLSVAKEIQHDLFLQNPENKLKVYSLDSLEEIKPIFFKSDLFINATSIGMKHDDQLPFDTNLLHSNFIILDSVYYSQSIFKKIAKEKNIFYISGLKMLIYQAIKQFNIWNDNFFTNEEEMDLYQKVKIEIAAQGIEPRTSGL